MLLSACVCERGSDTMQRNDEEKKLKIKMKNGCLCICWLSYHFYLYHSTKISCWIQSAFLSFVGFMSFPSEKTTWVYLCNNIRCVHTSKIVTSINHYIFIQSVLARMCVCVYADVQCLKIKTIVEQSLLCGLNSMD